MRVRPGQVPQFLLQVIVQVFGGIVLRRVGRQEKRIFSSPRSGSMRWIGRWIGWKSI